MQGSVCTRVYKWGVSAGVCVWGYGLCVHVLGEWRVWVYACGSSEAWVCRHACVSMHGCGCAHGCAYVYVGVGVHKYTSVYLTMFLLASSSPWCPAFPELFCLLPIIFPLCSAPPWLSIPH